MAYFSERRWRREAIAIDLVDEVSEGDVVTIRVSVGDVALSIMGEVRENGGRLIARGVHVSSEGVDPNDIGVANLREIARAVMEVGGYDEIVVEGAVRTTGAHPGRRPDSLRFARRRLFGSGRRTGQDEVG